MLDSPSNKRIFPPGRYMAFAFIFITVFVLISVLSVFIIPVSSYSFLKYNQSPISALISSLFSNSTPNSPQFSRKFYGGSRKGDAFASIYDYNHQIPKPTNGVSIKPPPQKGLSFDHDFSSGKGTQSPDDAKVSKKTNGDFKKVESPQGSVENGHNQSKIIGNIEALNFSRNDDDDKEKKKEKKNWIEKMTHCRFFNGRWVNDQRQPLYKPGSCPFIDGSFDCFTNGKPTTVSPKVLV